jgi:hypothetical protein
VGFCRGEFVPILRLLRVSRLLLLVTLVRPSIEFEKKKYVKACSSPRSVLICSTAIRNNCTTQVRAIVSVGLGFLGCHKIVFRQRQKQGIYFELTLY